jgi:phenylpropionate dioxygenase-like ring-hydroxylating dioxygenase large terminal subunit
MFPHHLVTLLYRPLAADRTFEYLDVLVHPSVKADRQFDEVLDRITSFWAFVNDQDIRLVENVQSGIQSQGYQGGRLCYHFEEPVHRFQNMVADHMIGELRIPRGDTQHTAPALTPESAPLP